MNDRIANQSGTCDTYGRCYCGDVRFQIAAGTEPYWAGYCHCKDCRQAHAAPIYQYVYVKKQYFEIVQGEELLRWYTRADPKKNSLKRYFCERCGSKVYTDKVTMKNDTAVELCGTFPSLFDDQEIAASKIWSPRLHVYCAQSLMDLTLLHDELPRLQTE